MLLEQITKIKITVPGTVAILHIAHKFCFGGYAT